jgi:hypothetical protein
MKKKTAVFARFSKILFVITEILFVITRKDSAGITLNQTDDALLFVINGSSL